MSRKEGKLIYFIEAVGMNQIKIGRTSDVAKRLRTLQIANATKLELVRVIKGGSFRERQLQAMFSPFLLHGEWFSAAEVKNSFYLIEEVPLSIEDILAAPRRFGIADRSEVRDTRPITRVASIVGSKVSTAVERTKLALRTRAEERLTRNDDDKKALQDMLRTLVSWISSNVSFDDLPPWFPEASHMASYGNPARRGARPLMRRPDK